MSLFRSLGPWVGAGFGRVGLGESFSSVYLLIFPIYFWQQKKWKGSILFFYFLNNYYFNGNLAATIEEKHTLISLGSRKIGFSPKSKACKFHQTWPWAAHNLPWTSLSQTMWEKKDPHGQLWPCKQKQGMSQNQSHEEEEYDKAFALWKHMGVGEQGRQAKNKYLKKNFFF